MERDFGYLETAGRGRSGSRDTAAPPATCGLVLHRRQMTGEMSREMSGRTFPARNVLKCTAEMSAGTFRAGNVRGMGRRDIFRRRGANALRGSAFPASTARRPLRDRPPVGARSSSTSERNSPRSASNSPPAIRRLSRWVPVGICRVLQWPPATCATRPRIEGAAGWLRDWRAGSPFRRTSRPDSVFEDGIHPGEERLVGAGGFGERRPQVAEPLPDPPRLRRRAVHPPQQGGGFLLEGGDRCRVGALGEVRNRLHPEPLRLAEPADAVRRHRHQLRLVFAGRGERTHRRPDPGRGEAGGLQVHRVRGRPAQVPRDPVDALLRGTGDPPHRGAPFVADHHEDRRSRLQALRAQGVEAGERDVVAPFAGLLLPGAALLPRRLEVLVRK